MRVQDNNGDIRAFDRARWRRVGGEMHILDAEGRLRVVFGDGKWSCYTLDPCDTELRGEDDE